MADFELDALKGEKAIAMRKYKRMHYITKLFRLTEAFLFLFFLFPWFSSRLPAAARISGDYLQRLLHVLASQKVVFVVGNAIIVTLLVKSGFLGGCRRLSGGDLYDELVRNIEHVQPSRTWERLEEDAAQASPRVPEADEGGAVFEDKAVCVVERTQLPHSYRRSLSEKQRTTRNSCRELRRTETEKIWMDRTPPFSGFPYDEAYVSVLSNEEFQRTVDTFISKQIQFRRQESLAFVVQSQ